MDQIASIADGFLALTDPGVFACMIGGFFIGVFFAAVPGLTATLAIALLLPFTFSLDVTSALVMCASIFMAGQYAGSITAITINIPGAPSSVLAALEGHKMMLRGEGARALRHAALASGISGVVGAILLMAASPLVAKASLLIRTPGKFSLLLFALFIVILSYRGAYIKGVIATTFGIMIGTIGIDVLTPVPRQTLGTGALVEGIDLMALVIGIFAVSEVLKQSLAASQSDPGGDGRSVKFRQRDFFPSMRDFWEIGPFNYLKFALIGFFIGVLPGAGGSAASFVSYVEAKRSSRRSSEFGKGTPEGIAAAEGANNAVCGGALVPMLSFGIPGDTTAAVIIGVLVIHGLQPGPKLMTDQFHLVTPMMAALLVCALLIPITLAAFGSIYLRIVTISRAILFPSIAVLAMIGAYVSTYSVFQMTMTLIFGVLAFVMDKHRYPLVAFILGFILGPDLEVYMRRSLGISDGDPSIFFTSPDSLFFLLLMVVFLYFMALRKPRQSESIVDVASQ